MPVLDKANLDNLTDKFESQLISAVYLRLFTQNNSGLITPGGKYDTCLTTENILTELSSISDKINLEIIDFCKPNDESSDLNIDRIPATIIGQTGRAIYYGIPSGYEFSTMVNSIINASRDCQNLSGDIIKHLTEIQNLIKIKVFVTPSCKYCPEIAELTLSLALQFNNIKTEVIEIQEYPELANNYHISTVPVTVINDKIRLDGQISSNTLVENIVTIDKEIRIS